MNKSLQSLALLSGKGGSGKTILSLSMCKVLAEAGCKVMLVDCDMSTHGATYFFESELESGDYISLTALATKQIANERLLETRAGFWFVPSTLDPARMSEAMMTERDSIQGAFGELLEICLREEFDAVIFDCQAGYSVIADVATQNSRRNLIVLEPDAVSSAALRVLFLQIGKSLRPSNTWQMFNKLTEEERPIYEKVSGGTLFPNLPPVPFDWQVRAAFATGTIPSITSQWSAFGLGVLRVMRILFPGTSEMLTKLENETVGSWYDDLTGRLEELRDRKHMLLLEQSHRRRSKTIKSARSLLAFTALVAMPLAIISLLSALGLTGASRILELITSSMRDSVLALLSILALTFASWRYVRSVADVDAEYEQDRFQEGIAGLQSEMDKYSTLLRTDPSLLEYERLKLHSLKV